jgi:hypothetical protein
MGDICNSLHNSLVGGIFTAFIINERITGRGKKNIRLYIASMKVFPKSMKNSEPVKSH